MYKNKEKLHEIPLTTKLYIQTINAKIKQACVCYHEEVT